MSVFGTQMHVVTFSLVNLEIIFLFYLWVFKLSRPDDRSTMLDIFLLLSLISYNIIGGLLPDPKLPGSFFLQSIIAYAIGFITPCYFPYYLHKSLGLMKLKFHTYRGVYYFLVLPYFCFVLIFWISGNLRDAQYIMVIPTIYGNVFAVSLFKAIRFKYQNNLKNRQIRQEMMVLLLSLTPWIELPVIDYLNPGQAIEVLATNIGFLLLIGLQVHRNIEQLKSEHGRLLESEKRLKSWNADLKKEVEKRTKELEDITEQRMNNFINLVHETKTPLTLVQNYIDEYISRYGPVRELDVIKGGIDKITTDVLNLFDIERFTKGIAIYKQNSISNFSVILKDSLPLFQRYCYKRNIKCSAAIEDSLMVNAESGAICRIINNLVENAIKFTEKDGEIVLSLSKNNNKIIFSVKDTGKGIPSKLQKKIFRPYYQISRKNSNLQGMGLGLPIVKKVVEGLSGTIKIESNPPKFKGTKIIITLPACQAGSNYNKETSGISVHKLNYELATHNIADSNTSPNKRSLLIIEDSRQLINFLNRKLSVVYNVFCASNGVEAFKTLNKIQVIPDLILSDIMMDRMDGFSFAKRLLEQARFAHIPLIFLTAKSTRTDRMKGLNLGATAFITKPFSFDELNLKIETVLTNIDKQRSALLKASVVNLKSPMTVASAIPRVPRKSTLEDNCKLLLFTPREIDVVHLVVIGKTYRAIAKDLFISERTVTKHIQNIFIKAEVSNKIALINKLSK